MALKVGELFASFNLDTSGISSAVSGAEKKLSELGKGLTIGGAALTAAVTAPLTKAAKTIYNAGSGFDAQMSKVFAIIGEEATGSAENMAALRKEALEMGSTTSFTASEAGEAMQYMAMAGWKVDDMLSGLAPIMDLAAASGESLGTVSDIVTDALTAFGMTAEETAHFTDVLAAASSNSNTNVAIMGESFKYVAPLAGSLGYSVDDVAVALGLMANAGIKGSMAGTSLRQVLSNLISPTDAQAEAMKALGVSLFDSNGKVEGFAELMGDLRKAASESGFDMQELNRQVADLDQQLSNGSITQDQYDARIQEMTAGNNEFLKAISDLAGARGLSGLLAIMNATEEDFKKLTKAVEGSSGAAKTMAKTMLDNAQGDITLFNSALEGLEITLWGLAEGGFRKAVQSATDLVESFRNADQETLEGTLRMAGLAAAVGPVMVALGGIITALPKVAGAFKVLAGPGALLTVGLIALGAAAMDSGNSMGKTFVKGAAKAGKKVRQFGRDVKKQIPQLTENMNEFLGSLSEGIQEGVPALLDGLGDILTTGISALAGSMGKIASVPQNLIRSLAQGIKSNLPQLVPAAISLVTELAGAVIRNLPTIIDAGITLFTGLIDTLDKVNWAEIGTQINTAVTTALAEIRTNFYTLVFGKEPTEDDLGDWGTLGSKIVRNIKAGIEKASGNGKNLLGGLALGEDYDPGDTWGTVASKIWEKITSSMGSLLENAGDLLKGLVLGDDYSADASWGTVASKIWGTITSAFDLLKATAKEVLGNIVLGDDYTADASWGTIGAAIWGKITSSFDTLKATAKDVFGSIVLGNEYEADTSWETIGKEIWNKAKAGFSGSFSSAKEIIGNLVLGDDYDPGDSWKKIGSVIWEKAKSGFRSAYQSASELIGSFVLGSDYTADASWGDIGTKIWETAKAGFDSAFTSAKEIIGEFVLGDDYSPDSSWADIGQAIWDTAKNRFSTLAADAKSILGTFALGEGYTADTSWGTVGQAIWDKAKEKIDSLANTAKDLVGSLVLGGDYTADTSWSTVGKAVWNTAKSGFDVLASAAKNFVGSLVLGDDYDPGESWKIIGSSIWQKAKEGFSGAFTLTKEIIGEFVLGSDYEADLSWENIGSAIWQKAKTGFTGAYKATKEIIGTFALGSDYTADESWADIGQALWDKIKEKMTSLSSNAKDLIGNLVYDGGEEGYSADASWADIGKKLWEKVQSGITAGKDMATAILEKIGTVDIDVGAVVTTVQNAGKFVTNLAGNMLNGKITWGTKITDFAKKIADKLAEYGWDNLGTSLGQVVTNLVNAITGAIPAAIDAAGNAVDVGLTLASGILDSLTTALSGEDLNLNFGAIVQKLITGITTVIPKMLEVGGKAVSAGAVLAGELVMSLAKGFTDESLNVNFGGIMQSIVTGLTNAARDLPTLLKNTLSAGAQIANAIMGSISSALADLDASGVANDLSQAAVALLHGLLTTITDFGTNPDVQSFIQNLGNGFRSAMSMLGDVLGDIVRYIFSEEGLRTIWNAGVALAQVLLQAFEGALTGIGEFMLHFFVDEEALEEAQNTLYSDIVQLLRGGLGGSVEEYEFTAIGQEAATHVIEAFKESVSGENLSQYNASELSGFLKSYFGRSVNNAIDAQVLSGTDAVIWAKRAEQLSDDFWNTLAQAILDNKGSLGDVDLLDLLFYKTNKEKAPNATNEIQRTLEEYGFVLGEAAQEAVNTGVGAAMDNQTNGLAADGFARAVTSGKGDAEQAVMALGNDVVEQFMLTMSAENGQEIGNQFVGGIITAVANNSTTLSSNATKIATLVYTTLSGILKYSSGFSIGQNFGLGLANGIANMTSIVSSAAWNLGITAANALSSALDEHSPSKVTGKSGRNFGLGFIGGIEDEMSMAQRVAESMGMSAAYSLRDSIAEMRSESVRQLSVPVQNRSTQAEQYTAENERIAQQYVEAIARALNGAKVVMQDEEVGMLVMPTVSKEIAYASSKRREATL